MLHTKFHGNRPSGCCKKIFEGFLPYKGMAAILVMCQASYQQTFIFLYQIAYIQHLVKFGPVVSEKSMF